MLAGCYMYFLEHDYEVAYQKFNVAKLSSHRLNYELCHAFKILKRQMGNDANGSYLILILELGVMIKKP